jgi:hypothetical protein
VGQRHLGREGIAASYTESDPPKCPQQAGHISAGKTTESKMWGGGAAQALGVDWIEDHHPQLWTQKPRAALASLNRLTTGTLLRNWLHGQQPILPDEGETEALPKHR